MPHTWRLRGGTVNTFSIFFFFDLRYWGLGFDVYIMGPSVEVAVGPFCLAVGYLP